MILNYTKDRMHLFFEKVRKSEELPFSERLKIESFLRFTLGGFIISLISFLSNFFFNNILIYQASAFGWVALFGFTLVLAQQKKYELAKKFLFLTALILAILHQYFYGPKLQVEIIYILVVTPVCYLFEKNEAIIFTLVATSIYIFLEIYAQYYKPPFEDYILSSFYIKFLAFATILLTTLTLSILLEFSRYQELLKARNRELERNNEQIKRFNYVIVDDIKSPLRSIVNFSKLISTFDDKKKYDQYIDYIVENGTQLHNIIDGIKRFQELDDQDFKKENIDLEQLLESVTLASSNLISEHNVSVHTVNTPSVYASRYPLFIIFKNLLDYIIKMYKNIDTTIYYFAFQEDQYMNIYMTVNISFEQLDLNYFEFTNSSSQLNKSLEVEIAKKTLSKIGGSLLVSKVTTKQTHAFIVQLPIESNEQ